MRVRLAPEGKKGPFNSDLPSVLKASSQYVDDCVQAWGSLCLAVWVRGAGGRGAAAALGARRVRGSRYGGGGWGSVWDVAAVVVLCSFVFVGAWLAEYDFCPAGFSTSNTRPRC